jgi:hypothetical protein
MWKVFTHFHDLKHESPHTGEKIYRCKHNETLCTHSIHLQINKIIQSVTNFTDVKQTKKKLILMMVWKGHRGGTLDMREQSQRPAQQTRR